MTSVHLYMPLAILASAVAQSDGATAREMLIAAAEAERALAHGEIVFRFVPHEDAHAAFEEALGWPVPDAGMVIVHTFRDRQQFRITFRGDHGNSRTIVSDGKFIDMGNGELWDHRYYSDEWYSADESLDDEFFDRYWMLFTIVEDYLFPLTDSYEIEYFETDDVHIEFSEADDPSSDVRAIRFEWFPSDYDDYESWEEFEVTTDPAHRLAAWVSYYDGEFYEREEWSDITVLEDGRTVMGSYRSSYPESDSVSTTTIDFSASKFDHLPHASEFVLDRSTFDRVVEWREPNPFAEEIEYLLWEAFGIEIDIEPAVRKAVWTTFIVMGFVAVLVIALELRRRRK